MSPRKPKICRTCGQPIGIGRKVAASLDRISGLIDAIMVQEELEEMREGTRDSLGDGPGKEMV